MTQVPDKLASWFSYMTDEDRAFLKRFVVASGSLKKVAQAYGVTYPTIRLRLDRLIQKIELVDQQHEISNFERTLRSQYADGNLSLESMKAILAAHDSALKEQSHE